MTLIFKDLHFIIAKISGFTAGTGFGVLLSSAPVPITTGIDGPTVPLDTMLAASLGISEDIVSCGICLLCGVLGYYVLSKLIRNIYGYLFSGDE